MNKHTFAPRILVVDDEEQIATMICRHLGKFGYDVIGETNPLRVVPRLATENILIVISDVVMPEMYGTDLLKEIKQFNGLIQVIMMTGYIRQQYAMDCMRRGALTLLFKPFRDLGVIEEAVELALTNLRQWEARFNELRNLTPEQDTSQPV